jgi:hypothetical protein
MVITSRTDHTENTVSLLLSTVSVGTCLFAEPLLSNGFCISAYLAIVAQQRIYMLQYYPPTYALVFLVVSFLLDFPPKSYMLSSSPHSFYMPCPSRPLLLAHSNYTWRRVQVMKLLIT